MSAKITLGSTLGGLVLLVIIGVVVITGSQANEQAARQAAKDSAAAKLQTEQLNKTFTDFVDRWTERIKIGNTNTNNTQLKIDKGVENILGNLTSHRIITNQSFAKLAQIENNTSALTSDQYNEQADKKVENIIGNMSAEHDILFKGLNITKTDTNTESFDAIQKLKKQIEALENQTKTE